MYTRVLQGIRYLHYYPPSALKREIFFSCVLNCVDWLFLNCFPYSRFACKSEGDLGVWLYQVGSDSNYLNEMLDYLKALQGSANC